MSMSGKEGMNLPCRVLFKQRDNRFYPPSAWSLSLLLVRIPFQLMEALLYSCIVYFWVGELLLAEASSAFRWQGRGPCQLPPWLGWYWCFATCITMLYSKEMA